MRLADSEVFIEIEPGRAINGEEVKFGSGKVIRGGMGQSEATQGAVDTVITNALRSAGWPRSSRRCPVRRDIGQNGQANTVPRRSVDSSAMKESCQGPPARPCSGRIRQAGPGYRCRTCLERTMAGSLRRLIENLAVRKPGRKTARSLSDGAKAALGMDMPIIEVLDNTLGPVAREGAGATSGSSSMG